MTLRYLAAGTNYTGTDLALRGCENDARDWTAELQIRGGDGVTLLGPAFTAAAFLENLARLLTMTGKGDTLVVAASCHGTGLPNQDVHDDEPTGRDQALVCDDYLRGGGLIRDDTLARYFRDSWSGAGRVVFLPDCCYSGSMTRGLMLPERPPIVTRYLPPADVPLRTQATTRTEGLSSRDTGSVARSVTGAARVLLLAACRDDEVAYDDASRPRANGAFTFAALAALRDKPKTYSAWARGIRKRLGPAVTPGTPQSPQFVGGAWRRYSPGVL